MKLGVTGVMLPELDFEAQVTLLESLGVGYYQYRPRLIAPEHRDQPYTSHGNHRFDLTPIRLLEEGARLADRLEQAGIQPWCTSPVVDADMDDEQLALHVRGAVASRAGRLICSPPELPRGVFRYDEVLDHAARRYADLVERHSKPAGVKVLIETHRDGLACSPALAWNLCRRFNPEDVGVVLDLVNFSLEGAVAAPLAVSVLRDYIDCVHIGGARRLPDGLDPFGCQTWSDEFCAMSESALDLREWLSALKAARLDVPLIIEDFRWNMSGEQKLREGVEFLRGVNARLN